MSEPWWFGVLLAFCGLLAVLFLIGVAYVAMEMRNGVQFRRVGLGFWGSVGDWVLEIVCCVALNRHDLVDNHYCGRCGAVDTVRDKLR